MPLNEDRTSIRARISHLVYENRKLHAGDVAEIICNMLYDHGAFTPDQPAAPDDGKPTYRDIAGLLADFGDDQELADEIGAVITRNCLIRNTTYYRIVKELIAIARNEAESLKASATLQETCTAPDEDAAVRELAEILCQGDSHIVEFYDDARRAIAWFNTRRPVDTRPTYHEALTAMQTGSDQFCTLQGWQQYEIVDAVKAKGFIRPDPAPAAEVPVFASVEEAEAWLDKRVKWACNRYVQGTWSAAYYDPHVVDCTKPMPTQLEALQALAAALTKATDR